MNKLYILCGIPFSGKSTLAKAISNTLGYEVVDLDEVKFELYGNDTRDSDLQQKEWDKIYKEMYERIENFLREGKTVIHDAGNFTKKERDQVRQIATTLGIETQTIFVDTPKNVAYQRLLQNRKLQTRFDVPDEDFESTAAEIETPQKDESVLIFTVRDDVETWINNHLTEH